MEDQRAPADSTPEPRDDRGRREQVLREALFLIAENGIAGASLRKLARRLGMSQPSLYHYFESKDALIDELVVMGARHMVQSLHVEKFTSVPLVELPHVVKNDIFCLWRGSEHAYYTRFLFAVAIENPAHQKVIRRVFQEYLLEEPGREIALLFCERPAFAHHLVECLTMLARAIGLCLIEERVLFGLCEPSLRTRAHADFVADLVATSLRDFRETC